jgi:hypothetical protein
MPLFFITRFKDGYFAIDTYLMVDFSQPEMPFKKQKISTNLIDLSITAIFIDPYYFLPYNFRAPDFS